MREMGTVVSCPLEGLEAYHTYEQFAVCSFAWAAVMECAYKESR